MVYQIITTQLILFVHDIAEYPCLQQYHLKATNNEATGYDVQLAAQLHKHDDL